MSATLQLQREKKLDGMRAYRATVHANSIIADHGRTRREIGIVTKKIASPVQDRCVDSGQFWPLQTGCAGSSVVSGNIGIPVGQNLYQSGHSMAL